MIREMRRDVDGEKTGLNGKEMVCVGDVLWMLWNERKIRKKYSSELLHQPLHLEWRRKAISTAFSPPHLPRS